jgi:hypothetical protein
MTAQPILAAVFGHPCAAPTLHWAGKQMYRIIHPGWRDDRAVDGNGLENRRAGNGTVGSNPTLSATNKVLKRFAYLLCVFK